MNWHLKHVIEGKIEEKIKGTRRGGRRHKQLLELEILDRTLWRTHFGRGSGLVARETK
jgi:hypothetical protein